MKISKNKLLLLAITLATVLILTSAVNATDDTDKSIDNTLSEKTSTPATSEIKETTINKEKITSKNNMEEKTINKTDKIEKQKKTATKTLEVNNYTELEAAIRTAISDSNNVYDINLNEGSYTLTKNLKLGSGTINININGNNQTLNANTAARYINFPLGNITMRNLTINHQFKVYGTTTLENVNVNNAFDNGGELTIKSSRLNCSITNSDFGTIIIDDNCTFGENFGMTALSVGQVIINASNKMYPYFNTFANGELTNLTIDKAIFAANVMFKDCIVNEGIHTRVSNYLSFKNCTLNNRVSAGKNSTVIISDDTILTENFRLILDETSTVIINDTEKIKEFLKNYNGNYTLSNVTIDEEKWNYNNLTVINSTINQIISNYGGILTLNNDIVNSIIYNHNNGLLIIDNQTDFTENARISGGGTIKTDNITKILDYIDIIDGNYTINDTVLSKAYRFNGNITLNNCSFNEKDNINFGVLTLNNCNVLLDESIFLKNYGVIVISGDNNIVEKIENHGKIFYDTIPEGYEFNSKIHIINNDTITSYFYNGLTDFVNPGDTLDFQGRISRDDIKYLTIDKPVNIITSTNDARLENFTDITYDQGSSGSNVTGITVHNSQFYVNNANNIVFNNITNIVENKRVGAGVGQTSIRGSNNITIKNSYISTAYNGGSSSLVLAGSDYCNIINNTVIGVEGCGNLIYLTTYGVNVKEGTLVNHDNKIINNTIIGPEQASGICVGCAISGSNNIIDGNKIYYSGEGIALQWGSGIDDEYSEDSQIITRNNTVSNNYLYGGCGIGGANYMYNNYIESGSITAGSNAKIYNNTCDSIKLNKDATNALITNNIINNEVSTYSSSYSNSIIENNTIKNINILRNTGNLIFTHNNITGTININGTNNVFTENNITSSSDYAFNGRGTNNTITNNHITSAFNGGDASVDLNPETNTIKDNTPISTIIGIADDLRINIYETETITFNITNSNNEIINKGNIIIKDETGNTLLEQTVNGEEINLDLYYEEQGAIMLTAQYTDETGEHLNATKTIRVVKLVPPTQTQISDETPVLGESTELTATFFQADGTPVNGGKAIFRVNGKTIRDDQGNVIYADVINGHVQPLTVNITSEWMKPNTTIQAIYSGTDEFEATITAPTTVNVAKPEATITLDAPTEATAGTTITLKATVTDGENNITS
ncbi:MAG: hypothetical protein BZ136_07765, partial [Methanosphaera sp. rholeuAM74]